MTAEVKTQQTAKTPQSTKAPQPIYNTMRAGTHWQVYAPIDTQWVQFVVVLLGLEVSIYQGADADEMRLIAAGKVSADRERVAVKMTPNEVLLSQERTREIVEETVLGYFRDQRQQLAQQQLNLF